MSQICTQRSDGTDQPNPPAGLWHHQIRPYSWAVIVLVTIGAYLNRSTLTLMPGIAHELDGRSLFGAASSAAMAAYALGAACVAAWGRRLGPRTLITCGVAATIISAASMTAVTTMVGVVGVRVAVGFSEAVVDVGLTTWIARYVPAHIRPKMFALFATLWMLPSLLGPAVADAVATLVGWRLAYALPTALMALALPILWRAHAASNHLDAQDTTQHATTSALLANGLLLALSITALAWSATAIVSMTIVATLSALIALVAVCWSVIKMMPRGAFVFQPGVAGVIGWRALNSAMFAVLAAFIPFLLTDLYQLRPAIAAVSLTITGVAWAGGSNLASSRVGGKLPDASKLAAGSLCLAIGAVGVGLVLIGPEWVVPGMTLWAFSGLGMGIASNTSAAVIAEWSSVETITQNNAAIAQAVSAGTAAVTAGVGVLLAGTSPAQTPMLFGVICAVVVAGNCGLTLAARRVMNHTI